MNIKERAKFCYFCKNSEANIDYKNDKMLRKFVSERGRITDRKRTGLCAKHQRKMALAIKRARHIAILPFVFEDIK